MPLLSLFLPSVAGTSGSVSLTLRLSLYPFLPQSSPTSPEKHIIVQLEQKNINKRIIYLIYTYSCLHDQ